MSPEIFEFMRVFLCVIFCAVSVKITDDFLDTDYDKSVDRKNLADFIGRGAMVYALLFMVLAAAFDSTVAVCLFLASYITGMFKQLTQLMPSHLTGFQESVLIFIIEIVLFGWALAVFSVLFMLAVQLMDDCVDARLDKLAGQGNLAHRFGMVECGLLSLLLFLTAWMIIDALFFPVFCGTAVVYVAILFYEGAVWNA